MKINTVKKGFSIPEVIVAISIIVLIIVTATNLLVSSTRANRTNINKIIAYNLAQEALEGFRNIRDSNWLHNQNWRGSDKKLLGEPFINDGNYIVNKKHNFFSVDQCEMDIKNSNRVEVVQNSAPWELLNFNDEAAKLYISGEDPVEYTHDISTRESGFKRWVEVKTIPYELTPDENKYELKIAVTAVVEWEELSRTKSMRIPTVLTDWKSGPL